MSATLETLNFKLETKFKSIKTILCILDPNYKQSFEKRYNGIVKNKNPKKLKESNDDLQKIIFAFIIVLRNRLKQTLRTFVSPDRYLLKYQRY